jgi:hypothetical protein
MTRLTTAEVKGGNETKVGWHREYATRVVIAPAQVLVIIFVEERFSFLRTQSYG